MNRIQILIKKKKILGGGGDINGTVNFLMQILDYYICFRRLVSVLTTSMLKVELVAILSELQQ